MKLHLVIRFFHCLPSLRNRDKQAASRDRSSSIAAASASPSPSHRDVSISGGSSGNAVPRSSNGILESPILPANVTRWRSFFSRTVLTVLYNSQDHATPASVALIRSLYSPVFMRVIIFAPFEVPELGVSQVGGMRGEEREEEREGRTDGQTERRREARRIWNGCVKDVCAFCPCKHLLCATDSAAY